MPRKGGERAPHRPDCQCVVCKRTREKPVKEAITTPEVEEASPIIEETPTIVEEALVPESPEEIPSPNLLEVQLDSLKTASLFEIKGLTYRVAEKTPECIVCHQLQYYDAGPLPTDKGWRVNKIVSLATYTMVKPI